VELLAIMLAAALAEIYRCIPALREIVSMACSAVQRKF
jgi:hypothetical protein